MLLKLMNSSGVQKIFEILVYMASLLAMNCKYMISVQL